MGNAEATRERILEAALAEFATYGIAGARVDRIAATAGCNKNLIYIYFENKETLFTTVLQKHLARVYEGVVSRLMPIADRSKGAIPVRVKLSVPRAEEGVYLKPEMGAIVTFYRADVEKAGG